jgi:two-component system, chemotaxis family, chemotaxis protein CheY
VRFLIVDDNVHMLNIVKTILRGFGAVHVFEAKETQEAINRLRHDAIDIVVLDYLMGDEDGVAFLRKLRHEGDSPAPYVPVIMLTAHSERTRVEAARDAGVTEFCAKPVTAAEMIRKVAAVIDHPRQFVRGDSYFGPDRRRREDPFYKGPERRKHKLPPSSAAADDGTDDGAATGQ